MRAPCLQLPRGARQEILQRLLPRCGWYYGDRVQLPTSRMRSHGGRRDRSVRLLPFSRGTNRGSKTCDAVRPQAANLLFYWGARLPVVPCALARSGPLPRSLAHLHQAAGHLPQLLRLPWESFPAVCPGRTLSCWALPAEGASCLPDLARLSRARLSSLFRCGGPQAGSCKTSRLAPKSIQLDRQSNLSDRLAAMSPPTKSTYSTTLMPISKLSR